MITAKEMLNLPPVGATVSVRFESIRVLCEVKDVKSAYGKVRFLISPHKGGGEQWVEPDRLCVMNLAKPDFREMCAMTRPAF